MESCETNNPHGIIVFGENASGKKTVGREVARVLNYKFMNIIEYHFEKSEIPYTVERSREDCLNLMLADIVKYRSFVITAVTGDFGDTIPRYYKLAVNISAPLEFRLERYKKRAFEQHGERVLKGGDLYEQTQSFHDFIASRSLTRIEQWAETLTCPILRIDGTEDWRINAANIAEYFNEQKGKDFL